MKKNLLILSCLAFAIACGDASNSNNEEGGSTTSYRAEGSEMDSASGAAVSASARQSEVDTNRMDIGTDRAAGGATAAGNFEKGAKLIAGSDCLACHQEEKKLVGPAYVEVADKYAFNDKNVDYLAGKIIEGGSGVWGQVPMTPHPNISKADAQDMARYILSLKK